MVKWDQNKYSFDGNINKDEMDKLFVSVGIFCFFWVFGQNFFLEHIKIKHFERISCRHLCIKKETPFLVQLSSLLS